jgi:hypothetical protein
MDISAMWASTKVMRDIHQTIKSYLLDVYFKLQMDAQLASLQSSGVTNINFQEIANINMRDKNMHKMMDEKSFDVPLNHLNEANIYKILSTSDNAIEARIKHCIGISPMFNRDDCVKVVKQLEMLQRFQRFMDYNVETKNIPLGKDIFKNLIQFRKSKPWECFATEKGFLKKTFAFTDHITNVYMMGYGKNMDVFIQEKIPNELIVQEQFQYIVKYSNLLASYFEFILMNYIKTDLQEYLKDVQVSVDFALAYSIMKDIFHVEEMIRIPGNFPIPAPDVVDTKQYSIMRFRITKSLVFLMDLPQINSVMMEQSFRTYIRISDAISDKLPKNVEEYNKYSEYYAFMVFNTISSKSKSIFPGSTDYHNKIGILSMLCMTYITSLIELVMKIKKIAFAKPVSGSPDLMNLFIMSAKDEYFVNEDGTKAKFFGEIQLKIGTEIIKYTLSPPPSCTFMSWLTSLECIEDRTWKKRRNHELQKEFDIKNGYDYFIDRLKKSRYGGSTALSSGQNILNVQRRKLKLAELTLDENSSSYASRSYDERERANLVYSGGLGTVRRMILLLDNHISTITTIYIVVDYVLATANTPKMIKMLSGFSLYLMKMIAEEIEKAKQGLRQNNPFIEDEIRDLEVDVLLNSNNNNYFDHLLDHHYTEKGIYVKEKKEEPDLKEQIDVITEEEEEEMNPRSRKQPRVFTIE